MNILNNEGHNPLHKATIEGKDKFIHGLLDAGALPSVPSDSGRLPHLVLKHASDKPTAALKPEPPAPRTTTSYSWSIIL